VHARAAGDRDAAIYEAYSPQLMAFACGLVGQSDASDVLGNAVVNALESRGWSRVENHRAYLYRAVLNEAKALRRRSAQRRDREALVIERSTSELPELLPEVREAVEALSVQQRAVILLTYWADLDTRQIAELLGITDGAVRRHLARGRARLREVLDA
jgi:RNA polymerase sigma-70 factor (ECF subfamily)